MQSYFWDGTLARHTQVHGAECSQCATTSDVAPHIYQVSFDGGRGFT